MESTVLSKPQLPMKLPGGENAVVDIAKLRDYCLDPLHPRGKHKARVFSSALGLGRADAEFLQLELLHAAGQLDAIEGIVDEFGRRYTVDFELERHGLNALIRSAWIIQTGDTVPRLTTCFVIMNET